MRRVGRVCTPGRCRAIHNRLPISKQMAGDTYTSCICFDYSNNFLYFERVEGKSRENTGDAGVRRSQIGIRPRERCQSVLIDPTI